MTRRVSHKRLLLAGAAVAAIALVAVLTRPEPLESRAGRVREGMTRAEVEMALGAPPGNYLDRMGYFKPATIRTRHRSNWWWDDGHVGVWFDADDRVKRVLFEPHPPPPSLIDHVRARLGL